jgi:hypothetical protein
MTGRPHDTERSWILCTRLAGVCALLAYFAVPVFHVVPWPAGRWVFFLIGPSIALAAFALLQACRHREGDVARTVGLWAVMIAGLYMHAMTVIQDGNFTTMRGRIAAAEDAVVEQTERAVLWGVNNVQLSLDIAFDLWIAGGAIFLAAGWMLKRRRRWLGILGLLAATFALGMNVWKYPAPPAEVGGIDGGPYLAAWLGLYLWLETRMRDDSDVFDTRASEPDLSLEEVVKDLHDRDKL